MHKKKYNNKNKKKQKPGKRNGNGVEGALRTVFGAPAVGQYNVVSTHVKIKMRYKQTFVTTLLTGTLLDQNFRTNSLFDPDRTSTGHQPLEFDQLAVLYNRYHIYGYSYHLQVAGAADAFQVASGVVNGSYLYTTATNFQEFSESPTVRSGTVAFAEYWEDGRHVLLDKYYGSGLKAYLIGDRFGSTIITNPTEIIDHHIMFYNDSPNTVAIHWNICINYYGVLHDPLLNTSSYERKLAHEAFQKAFVEAQKQKFDVLVATILDREALKIKLGGDVVGAVYGHFESYYDYINNFDRVHKAFQLIRFYQQEQWANAMPIIQKILM